MINDEQAAKRKAPILTTDRLMLRPRMTWDARFAISYYADPEVRRFLGGYPPATRGELRRLMRRTQSPSSWSILERHTGQMVGECDIYRIVGGQLAEVGYILNRLYWGKGYMAEAMAAVLEYAFKRMGLTRLRATVMTQNHRSRKLLERLGFSLEAELREGDFCGRVADISFYTLTRDAYREPNHEASEAGAD